MSRPGRRAEEGGGGLTEGGRGPALASRSFLLPPPPPQAEAAAEALLRRGLLGLQRLHLPQQRRGLQVHDVRRQEGHLHTVSHAPACLIRVEAGLLGSKAS